MKKSLLFFVIVSLTMVLFSGCTCRNNQITANDTEAVADSTEITDFMQTTPEILAELGIVESEKINSLEYVPMLDFFLAVDKARGCYSEEPTNLSYWYKGDTLAELDYLDDGKKSLLMSLCMEGRNRILAYDEIPSLELDGNVTKREALFFVLRMIADTYSCVDSSFYTLDMDADTIYQNAYEKGLIESASCEDAYEHITYEELCKILHKAIFLEYSSGGYAGVHENTLYDNLIYKKEYVEKKESKPEPELIQIPVTAVINDDLTVEWTLPEEYGFIAENRYSTNVDFITESGKIIGEWLSGSTRTKIDAYEMIRTVVKHRETKFSLIRCTYSKVGVDTEYWFDIDISNIRTVESDEEIKPGKYVRYKKSWYAKEISLCEPYVFEKGCYYVLKGYENTYRKYEYNHVSYECFMAEESGSVYTSPVPIKRSFGVSNFDDVRVIKVEIDGNPADGFVLTLSKESSDAFVVEESEMSVPPINELIVLEKI